MKVGTISLLIRVTAIEILVGLDVVLSLVDKAGNPNASRLSIRITQDLTPVIAGCAVEEAHAMAHGLTKPFVADAADALAAISGTVSNQQNLITTFDGLMNKLRILVKIGDEVSKVGFRYLLDNCTILSTTYEDTSLCEFCVASTLRRNEGAANFYCRIFFS